MGLIDRARAFLTGTASTMQQKASPYLFLRADGKQPVWSANDYASYVASGFERNGLINAAIMYKVRAIALTRLRAYLGDPEDMEMVPPSHYLTQIFIRPNPRMSWVQFEGLNTVYLNLAGNAYVYAERDRRGQLLGLYPLRPDRVYIVPDENTVKGYLYVPQGGTRANGVPFLPEDIIHVKLPNAMDEYEGLGYGVPSLRAAAHSVDVDNDLTRFLKTFMQSGAIPSGILKFDVALDDNRVGAIRSRWRELYGGVNNWADVGVLDQGASYQRIGMNFNEMGFESIDERNEARILSVLGVPGVLLDSRIAMKSSTYANKAEARKAFWEDSFPYELSLWDNEYEYQLTDDKVTIARDLSKVPALQKNVPELIGASKALWSMGMPLNQALRAVGMKTLTVEGGDIAYVPFNVHDAAEPMPARVDMAAARLAGVQADSEPVDAEAVKAVRGQKDMPPVMEPVTPMAVSEAVQSWCVLARFENTDWIRRYRDLMPGTLTADDDLHLTLTYADGTRTQIEPALPMTPAFAVVVDGVDQFETPDGYAIYLRVRRDETLMGIQQAMVTAQQRTGMALSEHSLTYNPHITLSYSPTPIEPFDLAPFTLLVNGIELSDSAQVVVNRLELKTATLPSETTLTSRWPEDVRPAMYKAIDEIARQHEGEAAVAAASALEMDRREVLVLIGDAGRKAMAHKATIDWMTVLSDIVRYGTELSPAGWREKFNTVFMAVVGDNGAYWSAALGFQFDVRNVAGEAWFQNYLLRFAQPIQQTSIDTIHDILARGQAEGWSIPKMQQALGTTFDQWIDGGVSAEDYQWISNRLPPHRTEMIARTETTRIQSAGSQALFTEWGVQNKTWLSTFDDRTRDTHRAVDGQRRGMDEPFSVGGHDMMHPGDMTLGAPVREIVNCRCTMLPE